MATQSATPVSEQPDQIFEYHYKLSNTTATGYTAVASGANSYTALPYCPPKGAVLTNAWFQLDSAAPGSAAALQLSVTGGFTTGGSGQLGSYTAATPVTGALVAANAASEPLNIKNSTQYVLTPVPIHSTSSALNVNGNNNVVPPGGRVSVYFPTDQASNTWSGVLVLRFREAR